MSDIWEKVPLLLFLSPQIFFPLAMLPFLESWGCGWCCVKSAPLPIFKMAVRSIMGLESAEISHRKYTESRKYTKPTRDTCKAWKRTENKARPKHIVNISASNIVGFLSFTYLILQLRSCFVVIWWKVALMRITIRRKQEEINLLRDLSRSLCLEMWQDF